MTIYNTKTLAAALAAVKPAVSTRSPVPWCACVLLDTGTETVTANSIDRRIVTPCPVVSRTVGGERMAVPHAVLSDILRGCGDTVTLTIDTGHHVRVESGRYKARIVGMDPAEFARGRPVDGGVTLTMEPSHVAPLLAAVSEDEGRPSLNRVQIRGGHVYATDGHRLHSVAAPDLAGDIGIPLAAAQDIARASGQCEVTIADTVVAVRLPDGTTCQSRQIEGEFPNVGKVMPKSNPERRIEVDCSAVRRALAQVGRTASAKSDRVDLRSVGGVLTLTSGDPDRGESELSVDVGGYDGESAVSVNWRYLDEALAACGESAEIELSDNLNPIQIVSGDVLCVVMPLRG